MASSDSNKSGNNLVGVLFWIAVIGGVVWFASTRESRSDQIKRRWANTDPQAVRNQTPQSSGNAYSPGVVYVQGYVRSDGTYVPAHYRTATDGDPSNNWSSSPNVNPYTGKPGTRYTK